MMHPQDYSNDRLFAQYGFTLKENPVDAIPWPSLPEPGSQAKGPTSASTTSGGDSVLMELQNQVFHSLVEAAAR